MDIICFPLPLPPTPPLLQIILFCSVFHPFLSWERKIESSALYSFCLPDWTSPSVTSHSLRQKRKRQKHSNKESCEYLHCPPEEIQYSTPQEHRFSRRIHMVFSRWFVYQDERKRRKTSKVSEISHVSEVSQVSQDSSGRLVAPVRAVKRDLEKPLPPLPVSIHTCRYTSLLSCEPSLDYM